MESILISNRGLFLIVLIVSVRINY